MVDCSTAHITHSAASTDAMQPLWSLSVTYVAPCGATDTDEGISAHIASLRATVFRAKCGTLREPHALEVAHLPHSDTHHPRPYAPRTVHDGPRTRGAPLLWCHRRVHC